MKQENEKQKKRKNNSSPNLFEEGIFNQNDIINSEISYLEVLSGMVKARQLEFLSSNEDENDFEKIINSLESFKNILNKCIERSHKEKIFINSKVF